MIFLYFFITIIVIVGIYFAVEFGVKYFEEKKPGCLDKEISASNILFSPTAGSVISTEEVNTTLAPVVQNGQGTTTEQPNLNMEELRSRLLHVLNVVKTEKQFEEMQNIISVLRAIKYRQVYSGSHKNIMRTFSSTKNFWSELRDLNSGLSNLDIHICTIEDFLNTYSNQLIKKHQRKGLETNELQYSVVVDSKRAKPKKI